LSEKQIKQKPDTGQKKQNHQPSPRYADVPSFQKDDRRGKQQVEQGEQRIYVLHRYFHSCSTPQAGCWHKTIPAVKRQSSDNMWNFKLCIIIAGRPDV
jgi:neutral trehalase